ncbi:MAG: hypothetical protein LLF96_05700 [Eubacteriales bacterium]|nr:hypothetical protein [Eubacteriales bacterium]
MIKMRRILGLLLCAALVAAYPLQALALNVDYTRKGSLEVQLNISPVSSRSGVTFALYRIGDVDNTSGGISYVTSGKFTNSGVALTYKTSAEAEAAAWKLNSFVIANAITPQAKAITDSKGLAIFASLDVGVYFVRVTEGFAGLVVTPFVISIPNYADEKLDYNTLVYPKAEVVPTPTPTPTATPTATYLPQTGVVTWPIEALVAGGAAFIAFGLYMVIATNRKRKRVR